MIRFENIEIGYKTTLFSIDSLELNSGNAYVLVGENGAGKSTFFKTITKEISARKGKIELNGQDLNDIGKLEISKLISFVPSRFPILDFVSTEEYLGLGRTPHTNWIGKHNNSDKEIIESVIKKLEIEHLRSKFTSNLSDGERQLVAIGRSLVQETPIIFLDEPTAFLDYKNKQKIIQLLNAVAKEFDKTIVLSSHDIELCVKEFEHFLCVQKSKNKLVFEKNPNLESLISTTFD